MFENNRENKTIWFVKLFFNDLSILEVIPYRQVDWDGKRSPKIGHI